MTLWAELDAPWQICLDQAWAASRAGSLPIGAAVVDPAGRIVGRGRNRIFETVSEAAVPRPLFGHRLAHAEVNALVSVDHATVNVRECVLYTTLEPCALCVGAIRMIGLKDVRYAARDVVAGGLELLEATDFMRRRQVQVQHPRRPDLEVVLIAMNVAALLWVAERFDLGRPIDGWRAAGVQGVDFGRSLFETGELRRLAEDPDVTTEQAFEHLARVYRADYASAPSCAAPAPDLEVPRLDVAGADLDARAASSASRPVVLIVTGPPASGKSTIGRQVAAELGMPFLSKDLFKETLFDSLGWHDRAWSQRLGGASMALLFRSAESVLEAGRSIALESNFYAAWDTPRFLALGKRYACQFVQVVCTAPGATLVERYERRARSDERHPGHTDATALDEWRPRLLTQRWDALELDGPVFIVDTTDWRVDLEGLVRRISASVGHAV
jgi:tRNA(Arg) A34 adenosine deaminase TadA/predicted kinase